MQRPLAFSGVCCLRSPCPRGGHATPRESTWLSSYSGVPRGGMSPDDPQRPVVDGKLGQGLALRSLLDNDVAGLRDAIDGFEAAFATMPGASPYRPGMHGALATLLLALAVQTGQAGDVSRAVSTARLAVDTASDRHPASAFDTALEWGDALWRLGELDLSGQGYAAALRILHDLARAQLTMANKNARLLQARRRHRARGRCPGARWPPRRGCACRRNRPCDRAVGGDRH